MYLSVRSSMCMSWALQPGCCQLPTHGFSLCDGGSLGKEKAEGLAWLPTDRHQPAPSEPSPCLSSYKLLRRPPASGRLLTPPPPPSSGQGGVVTRQVMQKGEKKNQGILFHEHDTCVYLPIVSSRANKQATCLCAQISCNPFRYSSQPPSLCPAPSLHPTYSRDRFSNTRTEGRPRKRETLGVMNMTLQ